MTDHLKFCRVCKNKKWDHRIGVLCGLTDNKPVFQNECKDYVYSYDNYNKLVKDKREFYEKILSRELSGSKSKIKIEFTKKIEDHRVYNIQKLPEKIELLIPFPYNLVFKKPVLILDKDGIHKIFKKLDGWKIKNCIVSIKWNEIICTSFQTQWEDKNNNDTKNEYLVVDSISNNTTENFYINWNMDRKEVGHYIELFKEKYTGAQHMV